MGSFLYPKMNYLPIMTKNFQWLFFSGCFFLLISLTPLSAQTLSYDILKGDEKIGDLKVEKIITKNKTRYKANSKSTFRIIFENELITQSMADFENDEMAFSMAKTIHNGKIKEHSVTKKSGEGYHFFKHPEKRSQKKSAAFKLSTLLLYFMEPKGVTKIFSENYQELCPLRELGNHTYELTLPGGKINHYVYIDGQLVEIKVFRTFVDLSFRIHNYASLHAKD